MDAKRDLLNNIIMQMSGYVDKSTLQVLEQTIINELIDFSVNAIETLPKPYEHDVDLKNKYVLDMFNWKRRINDNTKDQYMLAIKELLSLIHKPLTDISDTDICYYLHWYDNRPRENKIAAVTYNNRRRCLHAFFEWMRRERMVTYNPVENTEPKKEIRKPIDYFSRKEFIQLRDACKDSRERAIVEVLRSTGARAGELIEITTDQINWDTGDILILSEKSDRYRTIWLDDEARYYLEKYLSSRKTESPFLFPRARAPYGKISRNGVYSIIRKLGKRAGLTCRCYPHKLRKTLGMTLISKGVNICYIKDTMGHANTTVTEKYYAQVTPEVLRRVRQTVA